MTHFKYFFVFLVVLLTTSYCYAFWGFDLFDLKIIELHISAPEDHTVIVVSGGSTVGIFESRDKNAKTSLKVPLGSDGKIQVVVMYTGVKKSGDFNKVWVPTNKPAFIKLFSDGKPIKMYGAVPWGMVPFKNLIFNYPLLSYRVEKISGKENDYNVNFSQIIM